MTDIYLVAKFCGQYKNKNSKTNKTVLPSDRKWRTASLSLLSGKVPPVLSGCGGSLSCPGSTRVLPGRTWDRTLDRTSDSTGLPPPQKGPGARYQGRNLGPETMGYTSPPNVDIQQTPVKTLPCRRTTYLGGKYFVVMNFVPVTKPMGSLIRLGSRLTSKHLRYSN